MPNIFWIDKNKKEYTKEQVNDRYLENIAKYLTNGGGWLDFLTAKRIDDIFDECYKRNIFDKKTCDCLRDYAQEELLIAKNAEEDEGSMWDY